MCSLIAYLNNLEEIFYQMFCKAKKISTSSKEFIEKLEQKVKEKKLEPVKPGGIMKVSPVVDNYTKNGELRF